MFLHRACGHECVSQGNARQDDATPAQVVACAAMLGGLAEISCEVQALPVQTSVPRQPVIKTLLHDLTTLVRISAMKTQNFVGVLIKRDAGQVLQHLMPRYDVRGRKLSLNMITAMLHVSTLP